jgi:UDP-glucose 4-epimerase
MIKIYTDAFAIPSVLLRLTNIYGPRAQVKNAASGVVNWFVRLAVEQRPITIMGTGEIRRDFLHVDDCVDALLAAGAVPGIDDGRVFNIASGAGSSFLEVASVLSEASGAQVVFVPFSSERAITEPGDFVADVTRAAAQLGWAPRTPFKSGILSHYRWLAANAGHYLPLPKADAAQPSVRAAS